NLIASTSELLKQQTGEIYSQAASSTINIQQLQRACNNISAAMDSIDAYKLNALDSMKQTIDALSTEVTKAQSYLDRARAPSPSDSPTLSAGDLAIPAAQSS